MKKGFNILAAIAALGFPVFAGTVIALDPPVQPVALGVPFPVAVSVTQANDLYAYQFDLAFNPALFEAIDVQKGAFFGSDGVPFFYAGSIDNTAGRISFVSDSLYTAISGITGDGILATVTFEGKTYGSGSVTLENTILLDSSLADVGATTQDASITVAPEPGSGLLLGGALLALCAGVRRRYRRGSASWSLAKTAPSMSDHTRDSGTALTNAMAARYRTSMRDFAGIQR